LPTSWALAAPPDLAPASPRAPEAETRRIERSQPRHSQPRPEVEGDDKPPPPSPRPPEDPEAATMRRERAATVTVTAVPRTRQRDNTPPLGATGQHSVLDVRLGQASLPLPLLDARTAASLHVEAEPSTVPRAPLSLEQVTFAAGALIEAARDLGEKARAAAERARSAATEAEAAALAATAAAASAERAAEAAAGARLALERALAGDQHAALEALAAAQALHGQPQGSTR
jgi:hypothetical protein